VLRSVRVGTIHVPSPGWEQRTNLTDIRLIETRSLELKTEVTSEREPFARKFFKRNLKGKCDRLH
jgi:hypothetical protein